MTSSRWAVGPGVWALGALAAALVLTIVAWTLAGASFGGPGTAAGLGAMGAMLPMTVAMALFWVALVLGLFALARWIGAMLRSDRDEGADALEIVRRRYARGEIGRDEYTRLHDDLTRAS